MRRRQTRRRQTAGGERYARKRTPGLTAGRLHDPHVMFRRPSTLGMNDGVNRWRCAA
jgi:hypothetical protein